MLPEAADLEEARVTLTLPEAVDLEEARVTLIRCKGTPLVT